MENENENENKKIVLSEEAQRRLLKFFLKTSIPRKKRQEMEKKTLSLERKDEG